MEEKQEPCNAVPVENLTAENIPVENLSAHEIFIIFQIATAMLRETKQEHKDRIIKTISDCLTESLDQET
jgi:hypothetical protein